MVKAVHEIELRVEVKDATPHGVQMRSAWVLKLVQENPTSHVTFRVVQVAASVVLDQLVAPQGIHTLSAKAAATIFFQYSDGWQADTVYATHASALSVVENDPAGQGIQLLSCPGALDR